MGAIERMTLNEQRLQDSRRRKPEVVSRAHGAIWEIIYLLNTYTSFILIIK